MTSLKVVRALATGSALALVAFAHFVQSAESRAVSNPRLTRVAAGGGHSCALTDTKRLKCWGYNDRGQLGDGTQTSRLTAVATVGLGGGLKSVTAGNNHTCVLTGTGGVKCWGQGSFGALGDGLGTDRYTPAFVKGLSSGASAVVAGGTHTCAITKAGGVKCWGANEFGEVGDGTTVTRLAPVAVKGLPNAVIALAAGGDHTCAVETTGGVKCWGRNDHGQLGDGTTIDRLKPVAVPKLRGVAAITASYNHTCVPTGQGSPLCWGNNLIGQLGDGTSTDRSTSVAVSGLSRGVKAISAGYLNTCTILSSGRMQCWGYNFHGQLGNDTRNSSPTPVFVFGLRGVDAIDIEGGHACAHSELGGLSCWGYNPDGDLGNGPVLTQQVPVDVKHF